MSASDAVHPYITDSRTIINILLPEVALDTKRPVARGFVRYMPSPFYPASLVLFQLHGAWTVQVLATPFSTLHITKYLDFSTETILVLAPYSWGSDLGM